MVLRHSINFSLPTGSKAESAFSVAETIDPIREKVPGPL
jgi:hypothetical protein